MRYVKITFLFILCIILLSFVLCSCSGNENSELGTSSQTDSQQNNTKYSFEITDLKTQAKPILNKVFDYTTEYNIGVVDFNKDSFFISYSSGMGYNRSPAVSHAVYDIEADSLYESGKTYNEIASSGANVIVNDCLYFWYNATDNIGNEVNKLVMADSKNRSLKAIAEKKYSNQLLRLDKLNENEFVTNYCIMDEKSNSTVIEAYNVQEEKLRTLFTLKYTNLEDQPDSSGIVLETICAMDNKIYGIGREKHNYQYECYFYVFDTEGNLLKKINAPALAEALEDTIPLRLQVSGNYFGVTDYQLKASLYRLDDDKITCIINPNEGYKFALGAENFYTSESVPYFYYYSDYSSLTKKDNRTLYVFDTASGNTAKAEIKFDDNYHYLNYISTDEEGNLLICFDKDFSKFDYKYYYLDNMSIKNSMKT